jgi:hypothetical protein
MTRRDILRRRIRICRTIIVLQVAVQAAFGVAVWNPPAAHRHLFHVLWYASLFVQAGLALVMGKGISGAKEELGAMDHAAD